MRAHQVIVHEIDKARGGDELSVLLDESHAANRDPLTLFSRGELNDIVEWHRVHHFQLVIAA
jgi:hypothetical protein